MKPIPFKLIAILWAFTSYGQDAKTIKGIVVDRSGAPIPFCSVSLKGTPIAAQTNQCGEFELAVGKEAFIIVFSCMSTHDFVAFERRVQPRDVQNSATIVFQLKRHGKTGNTECKKTSDRQLRKLTVY